MEMRSKQTQENRALERQVLEREELRIHVSIKGVCHGAIYGKMPDENCKLSAERVVQRYVAARQCGQQSTLTTLASKLSLNLYNE